MTREELLKKANELPETPGVYTMYDGSGRVIYVGKAIRLKQRVTSYFRNVPHNLKTEALVRSVDHFEVILVADELDALITECSLIKQHSPKYNIKLKDGRGYPFIHVFLEGNCPRIRLEYARTAKQGRYFGPFVWSRSASDLVELLRETFKLPSCNYGKRTRPCLNYSMHKCVGFCAGLVSDDDVAGVYDKICAVLEGKTEEISAEVQAEMEKAAENLEFEKAALCRDRLQALEKIARKQKPVVSQNRFADYIGYKTEENRCCIFMLRIRNGYVVGERCNFFDEPFTDDLLRAYTERFYAEDNDIPSKIYMRQTYEWTPLLNRWLKDRITCPTFAQDKELLLLADKNASERILQDEGRTSRNQRYLDAFREYTGITKTHVIEMYDVSHLAGTDTVCGMIVCVDGAFAKKQYKKFKIERSFGIDDTACMKEAVYRRLKRFADGDEHFTPLPDLIVCDGGLTQVHAVEAAVASLQMTIPVIGFKKDMRHRTKSVVFPDGSEKLLLRFPQALAFCGRLQEEVHRYAIQYHQSLRDAASQQSMLYRIDGVGKARAKALYLKFGSIAAIKEASPQQIAEIKGISEDLAKTILTALQDAEA